MPLHWHTVTPSNSPGFLVNGTELAAVIVPGTLSRFAIYEMRTRDLDREYVLRDAETVSDDEIRKGVRPKIVGRFADYDDAINVAYTGLKPNDGQ